MKQAKRRRKRLWIVVLACFALILGTITVLYYGVKPYMAAEYGEPLPPAAAFAGKNAQYAEEYAELMREKGLHLLYIRKSGLSLPVPVLMEISDSLPPTAEAVEGMVVPLGETRRPDQLLTNIRDNDTVSVYFADAPDFETVGAHTAAITVEDASGNMTFVACTYSVRGLNGGLTIEAGEPLPDASAYLICDAAQTGATMVSAYTPDMTHHVGTYPVVFAFLGTDGKRQEETTSLTVLDTVPPVGEGTFLTVKPGDVVPIEALVVNASDETDLTYMYDTAPDMELYALQDVTVRIVDEGGNDALIRSQLYISSVGQIEVEARNAALTAEDFGIEAAVDVEGFVPNAVGVFTVNIQVDGRDEAAIVTVEDHTPPTITLNGVAAQDLYVDHPLAAEDLFFVEDVSEETALWFVTEPDWARVGEQIVSVRATDASGNAAQFETVLTLQPDTEPPVLYGVTDRNAYVGETIAYLFGVTAIDNVDQQIRIDIDSQVNLHSAGKYDVTYTATDVCGNSTVQTCVFTLIEPTVTDEQIRQMAGEVMAEITTDDMVDAEKLKAIFDYVRAHVRYGNGINHNYSDWRKAAFEGFTNERGDCYNIWAVTKALLDETDIRYISVERLKSSRRNTRHYWVNVDLGTGWYVFDPTWTNLHKFDCFMWTERQCNACYKYWLFDKTKYPELAVETFDYDKIVQMEREGLLP